MSSDITVRLPSLEDLEVYALAQWEVLSSSICFHCLYTCGCFWRKLCLALISLFYFVFATTNCSCYWLHPLLIFYIVKLVFFAPTYKLGSSWKAIKYKLFYDESFPARPFESKVIPYCIKIISCSRIYAYFCVYLNMLYLMFGIVMRVCIITGRRKLHDWLKVVFNSWYASYESWSACTSYDVLNWNIFYMYKL